MKVLFLEDDVELGAAVVDGLRDEGFVVDHVTMIGVADVQRTATHYDCLVLDRMVPDGDALALVDRMRQDGDTTPALLLTARSRVSRIRALGRRGVDPAPPVLRAE